jgi:hypothetical protein
MPGRLLAQRVISFILLFFSVLKEKPTKEPVQKCLSAFSIEVGGTDDLLLCY